MIAKLFRFRNKPYLNNAIVIADALTTIDSVFGDVQNFKIQFKKPFNSQAEFLVSTERIQGHVMGQFDVKGISLYFAYTPTDSYFGDSMLSNELMATTVTPFNLLYTITDKGRGYIERGFNKDYGPMASDDKVIFAVFEVPDTTEYNKIIRSKVYPIISLAEAERIGDRRYKFTVSLNDMVFGHRYSSVKRFEI